ncbi:hypothetical protein [Limosilactobacillus pontis]|uniref:Uncharacterized protein n=1 Tax=Limosilactobacillus pontis TaxID=35787 RepID=A0ABU7SUH2_9LACO
MSDSKNTEQPAVRYVPIILEEGTDNRGFPGLITSSDNGVTRMIEFTADGKVYHERDTRRIAELPFEHIKMKSPDGTAFYLSVSNDGQPVFTKVEKEDDSQ